MEYKKEEIKEREYLRSCQILKLLPISRRTLARMVKKEEFPKPIKLGRIVLWEKSEIEEFLDKNKI